MIYQHKELAAGRWLTFSLIEQMANVGSEVGRAINWKIKGHLPYSQKAFERALELLDLTLADRKNRGHLREVARVREALVDYLAGVNEFSSTAEAWNKYFLHFAVAVRKARQGVDL